MKHPTTVFSRAMAKDEKVHALKATDSKGLWYRKTLCGKDFGLIVTATRKVDCEKCLEKMDHTDEPLPARTHKVSMGVEEAKNMLCKYEEQFVYPKPECEGCEQAPECAKAANKEDRDDKE